MGSKNPAVLGTLNIVATPIGNLEDITYRAVRILNRVDIIAAEDTRKTKILLAHYQIHKPLISYNDHNKKKKTPMLIKQLQQGKNIALVTEAGTPAISDPGFYLIREAIRAGLPIDSLPGPTAAITALTVSGLASDKFLFLGFLPRKPTRRRKTLQYLATLPFTLIIYESPYRIVSTLQDVREVLGDRQVVVARELTKKFQEIMRGNVAQALLSLQSRSEIKGEITLVIEGLKK